MDSIPVGKCQCGCGQDTLIATRSHARRGWERGKPLKFIHNHHKRTVERPIIVDPGVPYGTCWCGCGQKTQTSTKGTPRLGVEAGEPRRYVQGHQRRLSPLEFVEEDRGFRTPCWIWQRCINNKGYGVTTRNKRSTYAHRAFYADRFGPIAPRLDLDHLCHQPACCNPEHLEPVTHAVNMYRGNATKHSTETIEAVRHADPSLSHKQVGALYGVDESYVSRIRRGWKRAGDA